VAYPDGVNRHWNDGRGVGRFRAQREDVDDVGFLTALADTLAGQLGLDPARAYATGVSNGAMMCYRLALEASERFCAIAPVAGAMPESLGQRQGPKRPVSVLAVNGTLDPLVPWQGGGVGLRAKRGRVMSVPASVEFWARANGCSTGDTVWLEDDDPGDGIRVWRENRPGGREGSEVVLYGVEGGGHTWPGGEGRPRAFGRRARDFEATSVIWEFFSRHHR
jgi:polyhydroxybutyrate depolymerase